MKIGSDYLKKFNELDAWLGKSTQKENFLKILSSCDKQSNDTQKIVDFESKKKIENKTISEKLVGAAENFMGKKYSEVNCYELVVDSL